MPPRVKTYDQKIKTNTKESRKKENEIEEIVSSRLRTLRERKKKVPYQYKDSISLSDDERIQNENLKPLGFWSEKLKHLESEKTIKKKNKYELYEFSESDDSFSPKKERKKPNKKFRVSKKKKYDFEVNLKKALLKKKKQVGKIVCDENVPQENLILTKEKGKLAKKEQKLTYSSVLTSTPMANKSNLLDAANFISNLIKLDDIQGHQKLITDYSTPVKNNLLQNQNFEKEKKVNKASKHYILRNRK